MQKSYLTRAVATALCSLLVLSSSTNVFAKSSENPTASQAAASTMPVQSGFSLIHTTINKSPNDKAIYQAIKLNNEMIVLLISDEKANKSLMATAVPIGSMEDPNTQQGLAHYLEHMILMGSKQYPETNSLDNFLTKNGGYNNASTTSYRTAYYFEVNHDAFDEAVTRFADTFAFPLLSEKNAKKEINAVNAEMIRAKSSDGHLLNSVNLATVNPAHPATKFTVGNHETLSDKPNSQLQTELENFYKKYYSANLTKAVLYSNQPIEKLAKLAENTLGKMENKHLVAPKVDIPYLREEDKGVVIEYKPIQPAKLLAVSFDMPNDEDKFANKSGEYLAYLFNNNTDGTLSDYLIKQGLSDSGISASSSANTVRNRGDFTFYVALTEKGLKEKDKIISLIFQQIEQVKKAGIQESYFKELQESLKQEFAHLQVEKDGNYIEWLAEQMLFYPLEHVLDESYLAEKMDTQAIEAKLAEMTLDNARILVVSEQAKTDQKTPYFEAGYHIAKISEAEKAKWLDFSQNPELKLPALNPYFATDFSLIERDDRSKPKMIDTAKGTRIYAMPSHYFPQDPKARVSINFGIMPKNDDLKTTVASALLNYMNALSQTQLDFQASVAGMESSVSGKTNGFSLQAEGYTQHLAKLMLDKLRNFSEFELNDVFLAQAKQRYLEGLDGLKKANSMNQANETISNFSGYPYFEEQAQREMLKQITLADIQKVRERLLNAPTSLTLLSVGNFTDAQVKALAQAAEKIVKNQNSELARSRYLSVEGSTRKLNAIKNVPNEDNALIVMMMANGYEEFSGRARASLLRDMIGRWYFDDLRTNKQLGYVVYATDAHIGTTSGLRFMVQSPNSSPKAIMAHNERFFKETLTKLEDLTEAEFNRYKQSLLEKLDRKPESLALEFSEFTSDLARNNPDFNQRAKTIEAVKALTHQDIVKFYRDAVIEQKGLVFISQALGTKTKSEEAVQPAGFEKVESIEALQKGFEVKFYDEAK